MHRPRNPRHLLCRADFGLTLIAGGKFPRDQPRERRHVGERQAQIEGFHFETDAAFPNPRVGFVRPDLARIAPRVDGDERLFESSGDVHRTAVHAHDVARAAQDPDEFGNGRAVEQGGDVFERWHVLVRAAEKHDAHRCDGSAKLADALDRE